MRRLQLCRVHASTILCELRLAPHSALRVSSVYVASHVLNRMQLVLVDEIASQGSIGKDRHEEASKGSVICVYKSVWPPVVDEELNLA